MRIFSVLITCLFSVSAYAQWQMPARQVLVDTGSFQRITPSSNNLQSVLSWLDTDILTNSIKGTNIIGAIYNSSSSVWTVQYPLKGTNIIGASYSNNQWVFESEMKGTNIFGYILDTNKNWIFNTSYVKFLPSSTVSNWSYNIVGWDNILDEPADDGIGDGNKLVLYHPHYSLESDFNNLVTKPEFYSVIDALNYARYDRYGFYSSNLYGSAENPPTNNQAFIDNNQYFTVPSGLPTGTVVRVHLWGGGGTRDGYGGAGGYTYGDMIVVASSDFSSSNPTHLTNNMQICIHIGPGGGLSAATSGAAAPRPLNAGRAAIWRFGTSNFNSYTNELLVAGGGGGSGHPITASNNRYRGGRGGGVTGESGDTTLYPTLAGGGATGADPGAGGTYTSGTRSNGIAGVRVWGGASVRASASYVWSGAGGDGFYGAGSGASSASLSASGGGGGGSGKIAASWNGTVVYGKTLSADTTQGPSRHIPSNTTIPAYGLNAGYPGNPGRVVFETIF